VEPLCVAFICIVIASLFSFAVISLLFFLLTPCVFLRALCTFVLLSRIVSLHSCGKHLQNFCVVFSAVLVSSDFVPRLPLAHTFCVQNAVNGVTF